MSRILIHITRAALIVSIPVLLWLAVSHLSQSLIFPDTRFALEKDDKVKIGMGGVEQRFRARENGLTKIDILFGGSKVKDGGDLSIALRDERCETILTERKEFVTSINSGDTTPLSFAAIPDSSGKNFCLTIHFEPKGESEATVFVVENTIPEEKISLRISMKDRPGQSLAFRPFYGSTSLEQNFSELNRRISHYKPWFLKHHFLSACFIFGSGASILFLILAIFPRKCLTHDSNDDTTRRSS